MSVPKHSWTWLLLPLLLIAGYSFSSTFPVAMDLPNHLARAHILNTCLFEPQAPVCDYFKAEFQPISYFFPDYTIMLLLRLFPEPLLAGKVALFLLLIWNLLGWYAAFVRVCKTPNAAFIAGLLLLLNNFFYKGFYAYLLGNGAFLFWIAYWWPRRDQHSFRTAGGLSLGLAALYLCHLAAFFSALGCFGAYALWTFLRADERSRMQIFMQYWNSWILGVSALALYGFQMWQTGANVLLPTGSQGLAPDTGIARWGLQKLVRLTYVTYNYSKYLDTFVFVGCVALLLFASFRLIRKSQSHYWFWACALFITVYVITPDISHGGADVDLRFMLPAWFALFLWFGQLLQDRTWVRVSVATLVLLSFGFNLWRTQQADQELVRADRLLTQVPPGHRLVEINSRDNFPSGNASRVNPFSHFATYYMLRGGLVVEGLLNCHMNPNIPYFCYRNADDGTISFKNQFDGLPALKPADLETTRQRFEYFLIIEPLESLVQTMLPQNRFELVAREGDMYLFTRAE